jgi:ABC-type sugar transport system substrate-binding protein
MNWHETGAFAPLILVMSGSEKYRLVQSLTEAAKTLAEFWPIDDGEEYLEAVRTCVDALHGKMPPADARAAFIRAAEEAGIPVITVVH